MANYLPYFLDRHWRTSASNLSWKNFWLWRPHRFRGNLISELSIPLIRAFLRLFSKSKQIWTKRTATALPLCVFVRANSNGGAKFIISKIFFENPWTFSNSWFFKTRWIFNPLFLSNPRSFSYFDQFFYKFAIFSKLMNFFEIRFFFKFVVFLI